MKKQYTLMQINVTANWGSTGKIAEDIGKLIIERGWRSLIAYGQKANPSKSELIRVGNYFDIKEHGLESRLLDNHGLASRKATRLFINQIEEIKPDIIQLHNIHGYYINVKLLFEYLSKKGIPIIWTLHDCWAFTGHCGFFDYVGCERWKNGCSAPCPCKGDYPKSLFFDASEQNYKIKKHSFNSVKNLTIVPVSQWLSDLVAQSYLCKYPIRVIHNGIDLNTFQMTDDKSVLYRYGIGQSRYILGVASVWDRRKGFDDYLKLSEVLPQNVKVVLVGLDNKKLYIAEKNGIIGIPRTENVGELTALYSGADIFVNLTYEDNYPTTNLEAMACGTPVITYKTGGSPEAVTRETGWVVEQGNVAAVAEIVKGEVGKLRSEACRKRAEDFFNKDKCFDKYIRLYEDLLRNA